MKDEGFSYLEVLLSISIITILLIPISDIYSKTRKKKQEYFSRSRLQNNIEELIEEAIYDEEIEVGKDFKIIKEKEKTYIFTRKIELIKEENLEESISEKISYYNITIYLNGKILKQYQIQKLN